MHNRIAIGRSEATGVIGNRIVAFTQSIGRRRHRTLLHEGSVRWFVDNLLVRATFGMTFASLIGIVVILSSQMCVRFIGPAFSLKIFAIVSVVVFIQIGGSGTPYIMRPTNTPVSVAGAQTRIQKNDIFFQELHIGRRTITLGQNRTTGCVDTV